MYSQAGTSDSGVFYVVKDRLGQTRYVKRPKAPPTSPPLASDFDQCTTRPPTEWGAGRNSWAPTTAPLPEDFDAVTYTAVTAAPVEDEEVEDRDPMDSTRRSHSFSSGPSTRRRSMMAGEWRSGGPSNDSGVDMGTYGEFGEYTKEMQQVFPSSKGFAVSVSKNSPRHHKRVYETDQPVRRRHENWKSRSMSRIVPKRGAEFDVVKNKILEETPEKTTTISTWRRRVADEVDDEEEDMSVYYLTPRDYEVQVREFGGISTSRGSSSSVWKGKERSIEMAAGEGPDRTIPTAFRHRASTQTLITPRSSSPVLRVQVPPMLVPHKPLPRDRDRPSTRTSPPQGSITLPRVKRRLSRSHTPVLTSTPIKAKSSPASVPFIPTRSGSTISSIKSRATTVFQDILSSCNPSLIHISDALVDLGISSEGHLRAISKMTENVRDREVREEAMKKGITVMEWALLLDKIRSL